MDIVIKTVNDIQFVILSEDSVWWDSLFHKICEYEQEYVPPLHERMPLKNVVNRFQNRNSFVVLAHKNGIFAGCFCCYISHPDLRKPAVQFILIDKLFRNLRLSDVFFEIVSEIFLKNGVHSFEVRTWGTNIISRRAFERNGLNLIATKENDRGNGIETVVYEKQIIP